MFPFSFWKVMQIAEHLVFVICYKKFVTYLEHAVETLPPIAYDRNSTSGGLKDTNTRRMTRILHSLSSDVQREALSGVE